MCFTNPQASVQEGELLLMAEPQCVSCPVKPSLSTSATMLRPSLLSTLHFPQQEAWAFNLMFTECASHPWFSFQMININ